MLEVEYRVLMWTLTPEQRQRVTARRTPFDLKNRSNLPPVHTVQTIVLNADAPDMPVVLDGETGILLDVGGEDPGESVTVARARPAAVLTTAGLDQGDEQRAEAGPRQEDDAPQVVANLQPLETRGPKERRSNPKSVAENMAQKGQPEKAQTPEVDLEVPPLPVGSAYVFAVEAKHARGACGNVGSWSAPLFSSQVEFCHAPRQLTLTVGARFGALHFSGQVTTRPKPELETVTLKAEAASYLMEHDDLGETMGLPPRDAWPLITDQKRPSAATKKYLVRTMAPSDRSVFTVGPGEAEMLPERRPHFDDIRQS